MSRRVISIFSAAVFSLSLLLALPAQAGIAQEKSGHETAVATKADRMLDQAIDRIQSAQLKAMLGARSQDSKISEDMWYEIDPPLDVVYTTPADGTDQNVEITMDITLTRDAGQTELDGADCYVWPIVSNETDFYLYTENWPAGHYEYWTPSPFEAIFDGASFTTFTFDVGNVAATVDGNITINLPFHTSEENYVAVYYDCYDGSDYYWGYGGEIVGDMEDEGPYNAGEGLDVLHLTRNADTSDIYEFIAIPSDSASIYDHDTNTKICDEFYCKYVVDKSGGALALESRPVSGYFFLEWDIYKYDDKVGSYETDNPYDYDPGDSATFIFNVNPLDTTPVYRFWSDTYGNHFYTASETEKNIVIANWPDVWTYEGEVFNVGPISGGTCPVNTSPVYRFWSDPLNGHFYTASETEKSVVIANWPDVWTYEGAVYCVDSSGLDVMFNPVYRFWSNSLQAHFYTTSESEKDTVITNWPDVWTYEGEVFYVD